MEWQQRQRSYAEVRRLLDEVGSKASSYEDKVRACGLVKAVGCEGDGSFEWVEPRWEVLYRSKGRGLIGLSEQELRELG